VKDIFKFYDDVIDRFALFSRSFTKIRAADIQKVVDDEYDQGRYWPPELIQINPNYQKAHTVQELVTDGSLHPKCGEIFKGYTLYKHQEQALAIAQRGDVGMVEQLGSGMSRILKAYNKTIFNFTPNFMVVTFPLATDDAVPVKNATDDLEIMYDYGDHILL
jgi:hypothetical protein